jgi:uncharacterized protein YfaS (alpha-2-macroglobulin family)
VALAPSLVAGLAGVRDWMARYPYTCLEQRVSRAIALGDPAAWDDVAARLAAWQDGSGLLKFFPSLDRGDASLTAYVLQVSRAARPRDTGAGAEAHAGGSPRLRRGHASRAERRRRSRSAAPELEARWRRSPRAA